MIKQKSIKLSLYFIVMLTGVFAWLVLSFAALKLSVIYASSPVIAYLVTYNISGIIFILYFFAYLKSKFDFKMLILMFTVFNVGIHLFDYIYKELILIDKPELNIAMIFVSVIINLIIMSIIYFILRKIIKYNKS